MPHTKDTERAVSYQNQATAEGVSNVYIIDIVQVVLGSWKWLDVYSRPLALEELGNSAQKATSNKISKFTYLSLPGDEGGVKEKKIHGDCYIMNTGPRLSPLPRLHSR